MVQPIRDETLGVEEARRRLPELLSRAQTGATTLISRHGRPVAALTPLEGRIPTDPMLRQRHLQALLNLQGSGKDCWSDKGAPAFVQPLLASSGHRTGFNPQQLRQGDAIAFDGSALVAFVRDTKGTGLFLEPLLRGIAQGTWRGVISSLSLAELLQGPLQQGNEALAQRYAAVFRDPQSWTVMPADADLVQAAARLQQSKSGLTATLSLTAAIELATAIAAGAAVLVSDNPELAQTEHHPVLSALHR